MQYKSICAFIFSTLAALLPLFADNNTANYICSDPGYFLNQDVTINVVCVSPMQHSSPNVAWFLAKTAGTCMPRNNPPDHIFNYSDNLGRVGTAVSVDPKNWVAPEGGSIPVAVDLSDGGYFRDKYGLVKKERNDGYVTTQSLDGTFRAGGPNGGYFIDCTTNGQFNSAKPVDSVTTPSNNR